MSSCCAYGLKGKPGIRNPFAVATKVAKMKPKRKR